MAAAGRLGPLPFVTLVFFAGCCCMIDRATGTGPEHIADMMHFRNLLRGDVAVAVLFTATSCARCSTIEASFGVTARVYQKLRYGQVRLDSKEGLKIATLVGALRTNLKIPFVLLFDEVNGTSFSQVNPAEPLDMNSFTVILERQVADHPRGRGGLVLKRHKEL